MPSIRKHALVPYTAQEIFELVDDVARYAEFLPWCRRSDEQFRNETQVDATLEIALAGISERFSTRNQRVVGDSITMSLLDGPFRSLNGVWSFTDFDSLGSKVELALEYEFSNAMVQLLLAPSFESITGTLVDAFVRRAEQVYGRR